MFEHILDAQIDRKLYGFSPVPQALFESQFEARYTVFAGVNLPDGMRHGSPCGVEAFVTVDEIQPRQAEMHHRLALLRRKAALNQNVALLRCERRFEPLLVRSRCSRELMCRICGIPEGCRHRI